MKKLFLILSLLFAFALPAHARELLATETTCASADVTVVTTAETVMGSVAAPTPQGQTFLMRIRASGIVTTSANSTTYKLRIRRTDVSGTALGDAIAQTILVAAAGTEPVAFEATDERSGQFSALTYVSTIEIAGASANSTVGWNCLTVDYLQ